MAAVWVGLAGLFSLVSFAAMVMCAISAFQDEIWKGILCIICGLYAIYYALTEYNGPYKNTVLIMFAVGIAGSVICRTLAATSVMAR